MERNQCFIVFERCVGTRISLFFFAHIWLWCTNVGHRHFASHFCFNWVVDIKTIASWEYFCEIFFFPFPSRTSFVIVGCESQEKINLLLKYFAINVCRPLQISYNNLYSACCMHGNIHIYRQNFTPQIKKSRERKTFIDDPNRSGSQHSLLIMSHTFHLSIHSQLDTTSYARWRLK